MTLVISLAALAAPLRGAFWLAEAALSLRGAQVAACSPLEARMARSLPGRGQVTYVPNIAPERDGLDGATGGLLHPIFGVFGVLDVLFLVGFVAFLMGERRPLTA